MAVKTHGLTNWRIYGIHRGMIDRCFNQNNKGYHRYGGRGITVCERWLSIENFFADNGHPPKGKSIDRKNNDGNYSCGKCGQCTAN